MAFRKAEKKKSFLRLASFAPSGGGKTFTALRIAVGMLRTMKALGLPLGNGRIAMIDTENGSSEKYDQYDFDVDVLNDKSIDSYIASLDNAAGLKYPIVIVDSGSHAWKELLAEVDHIATTKYRGSSFQAWGEGTPKQQRLVDAITSYPGHVIWTMRTSTEWLVEKDSKGKSRPVRIGLKPEQGKGIEYEFDMLMEMTPEHIATVIKDRTGKYQDRIIEKPGEDMGAELVNWLNEGKELPVSTSQLIIIKDKAAGHLIFAKPEVFGFCQRVIGHKLETAKDMTGKEADDVIAVLGSNGETAKYMPAPLAPAQVAPEPKAETPQHTQPENTNKAEQAVMPLS